jgi:hypothetical protein
LIRQLSVICISLALAASIAAAAINHAPVTRHRPHPAQSHSPHAAESRQPHEVMKHAKPPKPPKHDLAVHHKPHYVAKH